MNKGFLEKTPVPTAGPVLRGKPTACVLLLSSGPAEHGGVRPGVAREVLRSPSSHPLRQPLTASQH